MNSQSVILQSVKQLLSGIPASDTSFDENILQAINASVMDLEQIGVPWYDVTATSKWSDYISSDPKLLSLVACYITNKVKLLFDPPQQISILNSTKELVEEYVRRINYHLIDKNRGAT